MAETNPLIQYRLEGAREALVEADVMIDIGHHNTAINRLYYACFYAVIALLLKSNLSASKHSGALSLFNRHFVKMGVIPKEIGSTHNTLFELRHEGDYEDLRQFTSEETLFWKNRVKQFVEHVGIISLAE